MPLEEVHRKLASLQPEERSKPLLEEAWKKVQPRAERHVGAILRIFGPLTSHADLLKRAKKATLAKWGQLWTKAPEKFAHFPVQEVRHVLVGYMRGLEDRHFDESKRHAERQSEEELPRLEVFLTRYRTDLNAALRGRMAARLPPEQLRRIHDQIIQAALRNARGHLDMRRQIRAAGETTGPRRPIRLDPEEVKAVRMKNIEKANASNRARAEQKSQGKTQRSEPPATVRPTEQNKGGLEYHPPIIAKAPQPQGRVKRYTGLSGAYEFVKDRLASAEQSQNPDMMREAKWQDHPQLADVYRAIKNHTVDGRPFGGHGSWNRMLLGRHNCSVRFQRKFKDWEERS